MSGFGVGLGVGLGLCLGVVAGGLEALAMTTS